MIEKEIKLGFRKDGDSISIVALDADDKPAYCSNLLSFKKNGTVQIHAGVNENLGFQLDSDGQIEITFETNTDDF